MILTRSFASVTLLEGSTVTLSCIPSVIETVLSWRHNGTIVNEDESTSFSPVNLNHNLILDNSDVRDSGQYTCRAVLDDEVVEQSITVTVVPGMYICKLHINVLWRSVLVSFLKFVSLSACTYIYVCINIFG